MDQVRTPVDQTLRLLYRTVWRRPGLIFNNRGIDLEGAAELLPLMSFLSFSSSTRSSMPIGKMTALKLAYYPIQMDLLSNKDVEVLVLVYLR
jgi:hypothetical protein